MAAANHDVATAVAAGDTLLQQQPGGYVSDVAIALYSVGAQADAKRLWRENVRLAKTVGERAWSLYRLGEYDRAQAALDSVSAAPKSLSSGQWPALRGLIAARRGDRQRAHAALDSLGPPTWHVDYNYRARIFAVLGEKDSAVANLSAVWYGGAYDDPDLLTLRGYPPFERKLQIR
jgi:hypothetical protein